MQLLKDKKTKRLTDGPEPSFCYGMAPLGPVGTSIRKKLEAAFLPVSLDIEDESARHAGHAGAREGGESHFRVRIVSESFAGLSRVERQRRVYAALSEELASGVHALALTTLAPGEVTRA